MITIHPKQLVEAEIFEEVIITKTDQFLAIWDTGD